VRRRPAASTWFHEHEVGRQQRVHGLRVRGDVGLELAVAEVLQELRAKAFVRVEHEGGQQARRQLGTTTRAPPMS
jgi:hypothetical protein